MDAPRPHGEPTGGGSNESDDIRGDARVDLRVYDVAGRLVRVILDDVPTVAGPHTAVWDGRDDDGEQLASGVYFCRLEVEGEVLTRRMVLLK